MCPYYSFVEGVGNLILNVRIPEGECYEELVFYVDVVLRSSYCVDVGLMDALFHSVRL